MAKANYKKSSSCQGSDPGYTMITVVGVSAPASLQASGAGLSEAPLFLSFFFFFQKARNYKGKGPRAVTGF